MKETDDLIKIVYRTARDLGGFEAIGDIDIIKNKLPSCKQYMGNNNPLYQYCMTEKWNCILETIIDRYK